MAEIITSWIYGTSSKSDISKSISTPKISSKNISVSVSPSTHDGVSYTVDIPNQKVNVTIINARYTSYEDGMEWLDLEDSYISSNDGRQVCVYYKAGVGRAYTYHTPPHSCSSSYWYDYIDYYQSYKVTITYQTFPPMWTNVSGVNRKCVDGWVNINNVWRTIESISTNINGTWRKSE